MKTAMDYLDDLKDKLGSDYKIAKAFDVDTAAVSMIRKRGKISDDVAIKIADLLEISPAEVLIAAAAARSEGRVKKEWEKISQNTHRAAILVLGLIPYCSEAYRGVAEIVDALECILC
jgi:plasmid maintenance system antidote protein VapI